MGLLPRCLWSRSLLLLLCSRGINTNVKPTRLKTCHVHPHFIKLIDVKLHYSCFRNLEINWLHKVVTSYADQPNANQQTHLPQLVDKWPTADKQNDSKYQTYFEHKTWKKIYINRKKMIFNTNNNLPNGNNYHTSISIKSVRELIVT